MRAFVAPGCGGYSRRELDELTDLAKRHGAGGLVHLSVEADGTLARVRQPSSSDDAAGEHSSSRPAPEPAT